MKRSAILILADGARYDVFEELLHAGRLPNIREHIVQRGDYRRMTTVFTSTTGPAYLPFFTGCFPGTANLPGIRWFDKKAYATKAFYNPHRFRSYCGWEGFFMNRDIRPDLKTLFDLTDGPINVFGPITRGLPAGRNQRPLYKAWLMARAHGNGRYEPVDRKALKIFLKAMHGESEFRFLVLPGIDGISHNTFPRHARTIAAYEFLDRAVGEIVKKLKESRRYDSTIIGICSDHGLTQTLTHFDVPVFMEKTLNIPTLYYTNIFRINPQASAHVSGNGMIHIYFKNGNWLKPCYYEDMIQMHPNAVEEFLAKDAVDLVISKTAGGYIRVDSARGSALIKELAGAVEYRVLNGDPFGFSKLPEVMTYDLALEKTFDTDYPDAIVQTAQIFRSERCGDLLLSAKVGYDLRFKWESPEHKSSHGSLHREHMMTPFCLSHPIQKAFLRSADVFPSILNLLGKEIPDGIDGKSFVSMPAVSHVLPAVAI
ncbi:alkaline phosphatase family protein [bacterium]|nr:alkaline phosphatase family protein [bacterium]